MENIVSTDKINLFDDRYYENYIQSNNYLNKDDILNLLSDDILKNLLQYIDQCKNNNIIPQNEIRFGYIIYTDFKNNIKKEMDKLLRYIIFKKNVDFYVRSHWDLMDIKEDNQVSVDKVRIKLLVKLNSREECIKKMANQLIHSMRKSNKKTVEYLKKINTKIEK